MGKLRLRQLAIGAGIVCVAFAYPLWQLLRFSLKSDLYSHILLVPLVSAYFLHLKRKELAVQGPANLPVAMFALGLAGAAVIAALVIDGLAKLDGLALWASGFVFTLIAVIAFILPRKALREVIFPLAFLVFMIPMPVWMEHGVEAFLQHGSASTANAMFAASGTTVFRQDLTFQLPGITLRVAPECSGIHSTLALLITSVVAGHLFLQSGWRRAVVVAVVIPLALVRNGFRVFTIGQLCIHYGPDMIESFVHRHGGPMFFALSLIPFGIVLFLLVRSERRRRPA